MAGIDLIGLIKVIGSIGLFAIVFFESGIFFGFFLPGDSILFTAGFLASQGFLNVWIVCFGCFFAAVFGVMAGYEFGKKIGPAIFSCEDSFFFHKKNLEKAESFYREYGKKTIVLARFLPVIRTFAPILAGVGRMSYRPFFLYNVGGAIIWVFGLVLSGYYVGAVIPDIDKYLLPIILGIIIVSLLPTVIHAVKMGYVRRAMQHTGIWKK